ncbi:MAG: hypothetical protein IKD70_08800 [Eggerthellaceae bacterium]|nr:hypothetical protein [Eggerthellaceae bacterium]
MNLFDIDLASLAMIQDVPGVIMQHMSFTVANIPVLIMMAVNITLGFMLYTNVAGIQKRDGVDCYPVNVHCSMIVWDVMCAIMCWVLAFNNHFFWLFTLFGVLEPIWVVSEIMAIKAVVKTSRQEEFGKYVKGEVTEKQAWMYIIFMICIWICVWGSISFILGGFKNASLLVTWPYTNLVFPWICWVLWEKRAAKTGTQFGNSQKVQLTLVFQVTLSWFPYTWFVLMMPFLSTPMFYLAGALTSAFCIRNYLKVRKLPLPNEESKLLAQNAD